jgi:hypothetical protein
MANPIEYAWNSLFIKNALRKRTLSNGDSKRNWVPINKTLLKFSNPIAFYLIKMRNENQLFDFFDYYKTK